MRTLNPERYSGSTRWDTSWIVSKITRLSTGEQDEKSSGISTFFALLEDSSCQRYIQLFIGYFC